MAREASTPTAQYQDGSQQKRECNDVFFLLGFLGLVIMTVVFAGNYGKEFIDLTHVDGVAGTTGFKMVLGYAAYAGCVATVLSMIWILIMMFLGEFVIWFTMIAMIAACVVSAIFMTKKLHDQGDKYYWWPAAVFGACAVLLALYTWCIRHRIKFAAKHLKVAGSALFRLPMTFVVAIVMVGVQLAWAITWIVGTFGLLNKGEYIVVSSGCNDPARYKTDCTVDFKAGGLIGVFIGMLFVFFWGALVVEGIVAVATAGSVGAWKNNAAVPLITLTSWLRAVTLNLGSICFGSLIVAILETIKAILNMLQSAAQAEGNCAAACLAGCLACCIGCIQSWMETFNRYAFTYVGLHGYSFMTAGRHVTDMFNAKGWTSIVNDDLTQRVFFLGNVIVGAMSAWIAVHVVAKDVKEQIFPGVDNPEYIVAVCAFLVGYVVNSVFMVVMGSAVTAVFVLWAEDPQGWQLTHPDHYAALHAAWLEIYPGEYNNGYGKAQPVNGAAV